MRPLTIGLLALLGPEVPTAPQSSSSRHVLLGFGILSFIAAVGVVVLDAGEPPTPSSEPVQAAAEVLGMTLEADAHAAVARAGAIAASPVLRAAIDTDGTTLREMAADDLVFPLQRGESLEVFRIVDGTWSSLVRIPSDAPARSPFEGTPARLEAAGDCVVVIATAPILRQPSGIGGAIVMSVPIDLVAAQRRITGAARDVHLVGLGRPVALVASPEHAAAGGRRIAVAIRTGDDVEAPPLSLAASLIVDAAADAAPMYLGYAFAALSALLLATFGVVVARGSRRWQRALTS